MANSVLSLLLSNQASMLPNRASGYDFETEATTHRFLRPNATEVDDNQTTVGPQGEKNASSSKVLVIVVSALVVILLALILATIVALMKKYNRVGHTTSSSSTTTAGMATNAKLESKDSSYAANMSTATTVKKSNMSRGRTNGDGVAAASDSRTRSSDDTVCDQSLYIEDGTTISTIIYEDDEVTTPIATSTTRPIGVPTVAVLPGVAAVVDSGTGVIVPAVTIATTAAPSRKLQPKDASVISFLESADEAYDQLHPGSDGTTTIDVRNKNDDYPTSRRPWRDESIVSVQSLHELYPHEDDIIHNYHGYGSGRKIVHDDPCPDNDLESNHRDEQRQHSKFEDVPF